MNVRHATPEQERYARKVVEGIIAKSKYDQKFAHDIQMHYEAVIEELQREYELAVEQII